VDARLLFFFFFSLFHLFLFFFLWLSFIPYFFLRAAETSPPFLGLQFISCRGVNKKESQGLGRLLRSESRRRKSQPSATSEEEEVANVPFREYGYK
jgi:hypothetical protein